MENCLDAKDFKFMYGHCSDSEPSEIPSRNIDMMKISYKTIPIYLSYKSKNGWVNSNSIIDIKKEDGFFVVTTEGGTKYRLI